LGSSDVGHAAILNYVVRGPSEIAIVTVGSSSCPPVAISVSANRIAVTFGPSPNDTYLYCRSGAEDRQPSLAAAQPHHTRILRALGRPARHCCSTDMMPVSE